MTVIRFGEKGLIPAVVQYEEKILYQKAGEADQAIKSLQPKLERIQKAEQKNDTPQAALDQVLRLGAAASLAGLQAALSRAGTPLSLPTCEPTPQTR